MDHTKTGRVQDLTGRGLPAPAVILYFGKEHGDVGNPELAAIPLGFALLAGVCFPSFS